MTIRHDSAKEISRIDLPATSVGFPEPPPHPLSLKILRSGAQWTVFVLTRPGKPPELVPWLEAFRPESIRVAKGLTPKVISVDFHRLPESWRLFMDDIDVQSISLDPSGLASFLVRDTPARIQAFTKEYGPPRGERSVAPAVNQMETGPSARQLEVLEIAVAMGYYEIPHRVGQRSIAKRLGVSVGTVSDLLRRGEASAVHKWVYSSLEARWKQAEQEMRNVSEGDRSPQQQTSR